MAHVKAPNQDYNGPGPGGVVFADGVAEVADEAALNYYRAAGYEVDGEVVEIAAEPVVDAREVEQVLVGTPLRDAAVDPEPGDYRAPKGAGESDPHGPDVVAPGIDVEPERTLVDVLAEEAPAEPVAEPVEPAAEEPPAEEPATEPTTEVASGDAPEEPVSEESVPAPAKKTVARKRA